MEGGRAALGMIGDGERPQAAILQSMGKVFDGLAPQNSGHPGGVGYLGSDALHLVSDCLHELFGPRGKRRPHVAPYRHHMRRDRKGRLQRNVGLRVGSHLFRHHGVRPSGQGAAESDYPLEQRGSGVVRHVISAWEFRVAWEAGH